MFRVLVIAYMGPVEAFNNLPVNTARDDTLFMPQLLPFFRRAFGDNDLALLLSELGNVQVGQFIGDFFRRPTFDDGVEANPLGDGKVFVGGGPVDLQREEQLAVDSQR